MLSIALSLLNLLFDLADVSSIFYFVVLLYRTPYVADWGIKLHLIKKVPAKEYEPKVLKQNGSVASGLFVTEYINPSFWK
mmetsp:Transcript_1436/g.1985  ORF Transcript_1436/g.1985 Transcript_1436/m.1985 type:complete len:80 (-) Transcript_1436:1305-1544(-)